MMTYYSKIEQEVDTIRLKIYERTKDMTREELSEYYRKVEEEASRKYGFKFVESANTK